MTVLVVDAMLAMIHDTFTLIPSLSISSNSTNFTTNSLSTQFLIRLSTLDPAKADFTNCVNAWTNPKSLTPAFSISFTISSFTSYSFRLRVTSSSSPLKNLWSYFASTSWKDNWRSLQTSLRCFRRLCAIVARALVFLRSKE
eukprot:TRINITY_DN17154_c0_g1_i3.p1 TRINITY_DN17154_c0_g1~~TRINITY_DN17154_c0_g1_i3.p1  ORF type:complete len:142 (+),score=2.91 TRINITY_DN17154_c0_g1_i3:93-518(+)